MNGFSFERQEREGRPGGEPEPSSASRSRDLSAASFPFRSSEEREPDPPTSFARVGSVLDIPVRRRGQQGTLDENNSRLPSSEALAASGFIAVEQLLSQTSSVTRALRSFQVGRDGSFGASFDPMCIFEEAKNLSDTLKSLMDPFGEHIEELDLFLSNPRTFTTREELARLSESLDLYMETAALDLVNREVGRRRTQKELESCFVLLGNMERSLRATALLLSSDQQQPTVRHPQVGGNGSIVA
ncbi:MAG: hypothetical protein KDD64_08715 [Bdellovibrionales bacterium]|nr:hypothetical protein [Bdellovibrionales bacterium]